MRVWEVVASVPTGLGALKLRMKESALPGQLCFEWGLGNLVVQGKNFLEKPICL